MHNTVADNSTASVLLRCNVKRVIAGGRCDGAADSNPEHPKPLNVTFFQDDSHQHDARPPHARYGDRRDARTAYYFVLCVSTLISTTN